ncbi:Asp-tRNA(Asn)/Glu-tRNA(Gln) amidotransferase subunit GatC [Falsiroseomonas sp.]|uniref:Asp-tRNA(Asn)/Glu-tRNA(Gln) amidotransferase subunit GatC n=1 Tax=Falsiroseomonas sp. TaxID=2870721 RepID=UPI0034A14C88
MSLDTAMVRRIASLARIRLEEEEVGRMQAELNGILGWIEQLQAVDTDGVEPMAGGAPEGQPAMRQRADAVTDGGQADAVLRNAPDRMDDYFGVPKVVE